MPTAVAAARGVVAVGDADGGLSAYIIDRDGALVDGAAAGAHGDTPAASAASMRLRALPTARLRVHDDVVWAVALAPSARDDLAPVALTAGGDGALLAWPLRLDGASAPPTAPIVLRSPHRAPIVSLATCDALGTCVVLSGSEDATAAVSVLDGGGAEGYSLRALGASPEHADTIWAVCGVALGSAACAAGERGASGSNDPLRVFSGCGDGTIGALALGGGATSAVSPTALARVATLRGHAQGIKALAMSGGPPGAGGGALLVSTSYDGSIRVWDPRLLACVQTIERAHATALAALGRVLVVGVGGAVESYGHEQLRLRRPPEEPPLCDEKDDDDEGDESLLLLSAASFPRAESKVAAADSAAHAGAAKGRSDGKPGARDDEDYSDDDFG
jgi:WD40 repeat protein